MPKLSCECNGCMHYSDQHCCKPTIDVKGSNATTKSETFCHSFSPKGEGPINSTAFCTANVDVGISCNATNCTHKDGTTCVAENVHIANSNATTMKNTVCASFCCQ